MSKKTAQELYTKMTPLEHILELPDMYIGSVVLDKSVLNVFDDATNKIVKKEILFTPGLYKICDEVFVNASDEMVRSNILDKNSACKNIKIHIDQKTGMISVWNDGNGIPVEINKKENVYIPELIFGHLLTSSNYKQEGKIVGGKNGLGAKLANIYSKKFIIETVDTNKLQYYQEFTNNMHIKQEPIVTKSKLKPFVRITFYPDFKRFGLDNLTNDMYSLLKKRVYDMATFTSNIGKVYLNDVLIDLPKFEDYIKLYYPDNGLPSNIIYEDNDRWKVGVLFDNNAGYTTTSFVNGINTYRGGTHEKYIVEQICTNIVEYVKDKHKIAIRPQYVKDYLTIFIDCFIENPNFNSQTKEYLESKISTFGSECKLSKEFMNKLCKTGIIDEIVKLAQFKEQSELSKTDAKKNDKLNDIPKLDDAIKAGTRESEKCTLILTEGDSAKSFAITGMRIIGREYFGAFPLKGKAIDVRNATKAQILNNVEFNSIKRILGLKQTTEKQHLRYGSIMILTDQDVDGSHIKGLLINMFEYFWCDLAKKEGFIRCMTTPLLKIYKISDKQNKNPINKFYTQADYDKWVRDNEDVKHKVKYYKGLGTSTPQEAIEIFKEMDDRIINFVWEEDKSHNDIVLAFDKHKADDRKHWLGDYDKDDINNANDTKLTYSNFIHKELKHFSIADNERSIPNMLDGLKPSQRKILYGCMLKKLTEEIKVAQLSGYISEKTGYHHGEASLQGAIINMAQDFVGSNNIHILFPQGQFGSRLMGGKDHASPRYIFTYLPDITLALFRKEDEPLYEHVVDDGDKFEPTSYIPILPNILINGTTGIGTGYSTDVHCYNPKDIINYIKCIINNKKTEDIHPWFRGFKGTITKQQDNKYEVKGCYEIIDEVTVIVTELPIGTWTQDYKEYLDKLIVVDVKVKDREKDKDKIKEMENQCLVDYVNQSDDINVKFILTFHSNLLQQFIKHKLLEKKLKLVTSISLNNMHLFNSMGNITKYSNVHEIISEFYKERLTLYERRKEYYLNLMNNELDLIKEKKRFIEYVVEEKILINNRKELDIANDLKKHKFKVFKTETNDDDSNIVNNYKYLTGMHIYSLTRERIIELENLCKDKQEKYDVYENTTIVSMWLEEIDNFETIYDKYLETYKDKETVYTKKAKRNVKK